MTPSLVRRLAPLAALAAVFVAVVFVWPALRPQGTREAFPVWRSIEGVPVVDELPDGLVGVVRIARERNSEQARTSVVLAPGPAAPCAPSSLTVGDGEPLRYEPSGSDRAEACKAPRWLTIKSLPGQLRVAVGDETWSIDVSRRDPRSCQLGRDRTCSYWLLQGGRFGETLESDVPRVQSNSPLASLAVGGPLAEGSGAREKGLVGFARPEQLMRCMAGAAEGCDGEASVSIDGGMRSHSTVTPAATTP